MGDWGLEDIGSKLANLTMYDVKKVYRDARNYALNISELEAKVEEATNDDPWGASTTLMAEIASATNNYADFGEIMQAIYRRFMEKEANEWRQIYKSLTLLEYLVKHGAERVVDDARSHLSTIKILRNFHYIDEKGKDQGINVRNRSKELSELLSDVDRIRQERRKARQNKNKYQGVGNGDFVPGSGAGRYGGFSSDQYYSGGVDRYPASAGGSGGGGGGSSSNARQDSFDEYDAGEDAPPRSASSRIGGSSSSAPKSKPQPVVQDLFSFDDDEPAPVPALAAVAASSSTGFDDFDDFQAAPPSAGAPPKPVTKAAPAPPAVAGNAMFDLLGSAPAVAPASRQMGGSTQQPLAPVRSNTASSFASQGSASPTVASAAKPASTAAAGINFDDLWATSAGKPGAGATSGQAGKSGKVSMAELARNQSANNVWGNTAQKAPPMGAQTPLGGGASGAAGKSKDIFDLL